MNSKKTIKSSQCCSQCKNATNSKKIENNETYIYDFTPEKYKK